MILIREFYIEDDNIVYTGRDTVMPTTEQDWVDVAPEWANEHLIGWENIECFQIKSMDTIFQR